MADLIAELAGFADAVERVAFQIPAPNQWTPVLVAIAQEAKVRMYSHHAEIEAMARDARGEREQSWEVWQDDMPVAVSDCLPEALHYLAVYQQDGPVTLKRAVVYRETITPEQLAAMHDSAREGGK